MKSKLIVTTAIDVEPVQKEMVVICSECNQYQIIAEIHPNLVGDRFEVWIEPHKCEGDPDR